ncbi:MAG TPA: hypothetical protein VF331_12305 [Polyangiales bacterium]
MQIRVRLGWAVATATVVTALASAGCGGAADKRGVDAAARNGDVGGSGHAGSGAGDAASTGAADAASAPNVSDGGTADGAAASSPPLALPAGSREYENVVNLVDADAAAQLENYLVDRTPIRVEKRHGLTKPTNMFLEYYPEAYDLLVFFTDHPVTSTTVDAKFEAVNSQALPGGGQDIEIRASGYRSQGRLKGVIGAQYITGQLPPLAHETLHYWANYLDESFGFSNGFSNGQRTSFGLHWGMSSVHGQLGGFDGSSLRCETPANATPPNCTALPSGRFRYVVDPFAPNTNSGFGVKYATFELYLMGLAPASEVPTTFQLLQDAAIDPASYTSTSKTLVVEGAGVTSVAFTDIVARHGKITPLAANERAFRVAFVVVSKTPASDAMLTEVAQWAAVFGNRVQVNGWAAFETTASGRATMDTKLGPRRPQGEQVPAERGVFSCDVLRQDCPRKLGCYQTTVPALCALSRGATMDQPCTSTYSCAPGFDCTAGASNPSAFVCKPYCDSKNDTASNACAKLCPGSFLTLNDASNNVVSAICTPN